jgi:arylsulfatase A-like enzyme
MRRIPFWFFVSVFSCLTSCAGAEAEVLPSVVMISLDGTRPADVAAGRLPSLTRMSRRGASAEKLLSSFPSNTFPNHVTLVTGVVPERHGIVDNSFVDPERGRFQKQDIPSWIAVEPIWSLLSRAGILSASYYWVGSEGDWPGGAGPRYWKPFSSRTLESQKVEQILAWLDLPERERPRLITSWFHGADHVSHHHGPDSDEVVRALEVQDRALQLLLQGIAERGLWQSTTLLVVSDHGMMLPERRVNLAAELEAAGIEARVVGIGGFVSLRVEEEDIAKAVAKARGLGLSAWRRADAPAELRVANPRFGPVVVTAPRGTAIVYSGLKLAGFHGHAPEIPEMAGILVAQGRGVAPGTRLPEIHNIHVAPTVLRLLDVVVPSWMEGRPIPGLSGG